MAERRKRKKNTAFYILIALALLVYFVVQWYLINRNKIETVKANEGFINDSILSTGIVCRQESVMDNVSDGYFYYSVENGQRVSSGMLIGQVYSSQADIDNIYKSKEIEKQIEKINEAENFMSSVNVDISITRKQLSAAMADFSRLSSIGDYASADSGIPDLSLYINKINVAMNRQGNLESTKAELESFNNSIKAAISAPVQSIYSPTSGYFMDTSDGYEDIASVKNFEKISYEEGSDLLTSPIEADDNNYGKMITDYKWSLCTYVTAQQAEKLSEGKRVKLSLDSQQQEYHSVIVEKLISKGDMVLVVLKSTTMDKKAAAARVVDGEILFSQHRGIKVPKDAIRIVDGQMGVYVKFSKLVIFKKINPIYQDENYVILPLEKSEDNEVELYDDIIVKGVNLYNGKYL